MIIKGQVQNYSILISKSTLFVPALNKIYQGLLVFGVYQFCLHLLGNIINMIQYQNLQWKCFNTSYFLRMTSNNDVINKSFNSQAIMQVSEQQKSKLRWLMVNKIFIVVDISLSAISLLLSFVYIYDDCSISFFLYYSIFYFGQTTQHFLLVKMPEIDVVKYDKIIQRYVKVVSIIEISYFFFSFMFWVRAQIHPFYCFLCIKLGLPPIIGLLFAVHFVVSLFTYITFLYGYINRKYYLLALGGFEVERRMIEQREASLRRMALIEPYYNQYPVINDANQLVNPRQSKVYKFDDIIIQDIEGEEVCSICLTRDKQGFHPIFTPCRHYFHRQCIENWAQINGKCPQCRSSLHEQRLQTIEKAKEVIE